MHVKTTVTALLAAASLSVSGLIAPAAASTAPPLTQGVVFAAPTAVKAGSRTVNGVLEDGSSYSFEVPADWNGSLLLYAHGYTPGPANPARTSNSDETRAALLDKGYALAGGSFPGTGWQTPVAEQSQLQILTEFRAAVGEPERVIAWGHSMGGEITALLAEHHPEDIDGAVPMCPQTAGGTIWLNAYLDGAYTLHTLLDPTTEVQLVNVEEPASTSAYWSNLATSAQSSPEGRARIALAAAFTGLPGWSDPNSEEPARHDYAAQQRHQYNTMVGSFAFFQSAVRADMESAVGGPFSWNTGVDYEALFKSLDQQDRHRVKALYKSAGLNLDSDLGALNDGPRIAPTDPAAIDTMNSLAHSGTPGVPVLTMQSTGDNIVFPGLMGAYNKRVSNAGYRPEVREAWVAAPGHCTFSTAEEVAALETMDQRLSTGIWPATSAPALNHRSTADTRFVNYKPSMPARSELTPQ